MARNKTILVIERLQSSRTFQIYFTLKLFIRILFENLPLYLKSFNIVSYPFLTEIQFLVKVLKKRLKVDFLFFRLR